MPATKLSKPARIELLAALRERYQDATREDKSVVLNEFVALTSCHRKHAIRLLAGELRTLKRRIKEWRCMMARELVQGTSGDAELVIGIVETV